MLWYTMTINKFEFSQILSIHPVWCELATRYSALSALVVVLAWTVYGTNAYAIFTEVRIWLKFSNLPRFSLPTIADSLEAIERIIWIHSVWQKMPCSNANLHELQQPVGIWQLCLTIAGQRILPLTLEPIQFVNIVKRFKTEFLSLCYKRRTFSWRGSIRSSRKWLFLARIRTRRSANL